MRLAATRDLNQVPKHQFQEIVWQIEATTKWLDRAALLAFGALLSVIRGHTVRSSFNEMGLYSC